jgi:hypothetical protein
MGRFDYPYLKWQWIFYFSGIYIYSFSFLYYCQTFTRLDCIWVPFMSTPGFWVGSVLLIFCVFTFLVPCCPLWLPHKYDVLVTGHLYLQLFVGGLMSYLRYLCVFGRNVHLMVLCKVLLNLELSNRNKGTICAKMWVFFLNMCGTFIILPIFMWFFFVHVPYKIFFK